MKEKLDIHEIQQLIQDLTVAKGAMESLAAQHTSAKVTFDLKDKRISVTYPLPKDSQRVHKFIKEVQFGDKFGLS